MGGIGLAARVRGSGIDQSLSNSVYHCANPWFGVRELEDELAVYQKIPGQFKPTVQELTLLEMFILHASTISHFCSNKIL